MGLSKVGKGLLGLFEGLLGSRAGFQHMGSFGLLILQLKLAFLGTLAYEAVLTTDLLGQRPEQGAKEQHKEGGVSATVHSVSSFR